MGKIMIFLKSILLASILFMTMFSCHNKTTAITKKKSGDIGHTVYNQSDFQVIVYTDDYKTLAIYRSVGLLPEREPVFSFHEDRLKNKDDSCFTIDESGLMSKSVLDMYNPNKKPVVVFSSRNYLIIHFFNIDNKSNFRKDRYFFFKKIKGKEGLKLIRTVVGKRLLSHHTNYKGRKGVMFATDNNFKMKFFWKYTPEGRLDLPDTRLFISDSLLN
jgi:hypothetical protein